MILAGDIGGTKSLLGLFEPRGKRPVLQRSESFVTLDFPDLASIVRAYLATWPSPPAIDAACFGVAGPVIDQHAVMTNVPWAVSARDVREALGLPRVTLVNDLEAMAHAVPVLDADELLTLQAGAPVRNGNAALIAAGTGIGESILHHVDGRLRPVPSEGGHVDFAARTEREWELVRWLRARSGRVFLESVVSGLGLVSVAQFTHNAAACPVAGALDVADRDVPKRVSANAIARSCTSCVEAMEMFVSAYGAAAGNLALMGVASAGVYVGGGIAPSILPLMTDGRFLEAFNDKAPMDELVARVPVHVILNRQVGILGAAVAATSVESGAGGAARNSQE